MSKQFYFILVQLMFITFVTNGQHISGKIIDSTQSPVPFATIALLNAADSSIVKGNIADENGNFIIQPINSGHYLLQITAVGFNPKYTNSILIESTSAVDLSAITLSSQGINLNGVSVSAIKRTIDYKNGNIIVNVEDSPLAKGNTVYDLFSKLPGVSINDNAIQLNGKAGVIVMIDGRVQELSNTQLINILKSMNAELVEKIELMKNPPVKYDASGTAGMINIKTKKTKLIGFSGSLYGSVSQGFLVRSLAGLSLNYKAEKITFFSSLNYSYGYYQSLERFNKKFTTDSSVTEFNSINTVKNLYNSPNYKLGADWYIDKKNIIGFKIDGEPGSYNSDAIGRNTILQYNNLGFDHLEALVYIPDDWKLNNYNVNAEHLFDTVGTILNFTSDYTRLSETYKSDVQNIFLDANNKEVLPFNTYRNINNNTTEIFASKLDFTKVINPKTSFEVGVKAGFVNTLNNYLFERKDNLSGDYFVDTALTNNYSYSEQTYAAYFNFIKSFNKLNMQLGVRVENTNLIGRNTEKGFELKNNYFNIFPNISIEYVLSEKNKFQLNLNRRIDMPEYESTSPFRSYRDQYSYFEGNPFLKPHYSNTIELTHSFKELLTNTFTYTRINNIMMYYIEQNDSTKVTAETIKNMKSKNYYAYSFFLQKNIKSWWDISVNSTFSYSEFVGNVSGVAYKTTIFSYAPSLTNTFTAFKNNKIEINAFYNSPIKNGVLQIESRWMLSFAIKKTLLNEKLDISIGVDDVFNTGYYRTGVNFDNQNWNFRVNQDSRRVVLSINYNFGKIKVSERETSSNEQEKERLKH